MIKRLTVISSKTLTFFLIVFLSFAPLQADFDDYLNDIEETSRRTISQAQEDKLQDFYVNGDVRQLNQRQLNQRHQAFTAYMKKTLRKEWKENTGLSWPTYQKTVLCKVDGQKVCRQKKWYYDMHHVIPQSHNGPHKWWNVFPLTMNQHNSIHKVGTECSILFPGSVGIRKGGY